MCLVLISNSVIDRSPFFFAEEVFRENDGAKEAGAAAARAPSPVNLDSDSDDGRAPPPKEDSQDEDAFDNLFSSDAKPLSERLQDGENKPSKCPVCSEKIFTLFQLRGYLY